MKRLFDIAISATALLALSPLMVIVAVLIIRDSPGGVFYRQLRVGMGRKPFSMIKFRSMVANADQLGGYTTSKSDARVTAIGRITRRTSIDELPQLLNVLYGDMSLVGPRPDVPDQQKLYSSEDWIERHTVRPGITGLAQALGRHTVSHEERTALDLRYVRERNFWLDMKILWWTARQISGRGSH